MFPHSLIQSTHTWKYETDLDSVWIKDHDVLLGSSLYIRSSEQFGMQQLSDEEYYFSVFLRINYLAFLPFS